MAIINVNPTELYKLGFVKLYIKKNAYTKIKE